MKRNNRSKTFCVSYPEGFYKKKGLQLCQKETPVQVLSTEFCILKRDSSTDAFLCILRKFSEQFFFNEILLIVCLILLIKIV